jgi:tRNA threonylcarbamoyladenosine modification (KEOPS) complex  Pcc1 subunit
VKRAVITVQKDDKIADVVTKSLLPETERHIPRTKVDIREVGDVIQIELMADDTNALRAATNSYLRWMKVTIDTYLETHKEG